MLLESSASLEAQWLRRIGAGDRAAFADLYDRYSKPLYSFALRVVNNPKDAEDVLQEVFLKIWEKAAGFDEDIGTPFTWAVSITRHKAIDLLRSRRRREHAFAESAVEVEWSQIPAASPTDFCRDESAQMWGAVNGLPSEQRHRNGLLRRNDPHGDRRGVAGADRHHQGAHPVRNVAAARLAQRPHHFQCRSHGSRHKAAATSESLGGARELSGLR